MRLRAHQPGRGLDEAAQVEIAALDRLRAGFEPRIIENGIDERGQRGARSGGDLEKAPLFRVGALAVEELKHTQNAVHRRADLMADDREEARFRFIGESSAIWRARTASACSAMARSRADASSAVRVSTRRSSVA